MMVIWPENMKIICIMKMQRGRMIMMMMVMAMMIIERFLEALSTLIICYLLKSIYNMAGTRGTKDRQNSLDAEWPSNRRAHCTCLAHTTIVESTSLLSLSSFSFHLTRPHLRVP